MHTIAGTTYTFWSMTGADPGEGHRGQMTPFPDLYQGSQKNDVMV